ncbi:MAG: tetratricopeptide repeat protein [Pseudomonadota bacterium]|jgi:tetratricopeptide (TPR) repeat protein|nr:hypothetical protein [Alphaproteobacteria bacterium]
MIHSSVAKLFFILFSICYAQSLLATDSISPISISCATINNSGYLQLNSTENTQLAIFSLRDRWYIVWDTKKPDIKINIPPIEELPAGFISLKQATDIQASRPCTILSFEVPAEMMPMVTKTEKGWAIHMVSEYLLKDNPNPNQISFDHQNAGQFRIINVGNASFITLTMPTKEDLSILLTDHPDTGLDTAQYGYADVYESVQGACLYLKSDQLSVEKQGQDAAYYPIKDPLLHSQEELKSVDTSPNITFMRPGTLTNAFRNSLAEKAIYDKKQRHLHLLRQAWVELALAEGDEAMQTILLLGRERPAFTKSLSYQLVLGMAQCVSQKYIQSLETLSPLPNTPEINLWRNISKSQLDKPALFDENNVTILKNYPVNLREYILIKLIPYLFESRQIKLLQRILQDIAPQTESTQALMAFYKAMYTFTLEDREQGYKLLLPIAKNETPYPMPFEYVTEARLETFFHDHGSDSVDSIITELDILRTQARGHDIEVKICLKLIEQLEKKQNYPAIIELLQDLLTRFKKFDVALGFHQLLNSYLEKFFITNASDVSPTKVIGLFTQYKQIIVHYSIYETIAVHVASLYEKLDLLDKAIQLLSEIATKTTNINKRAEYQLKIAQLYIQRSKPEEAVHILINTHSKFEEKYKHQAYTILAKAYHLKNDPHTAIHWLRHHPSKENLKEIIEIYNEQEDYQHLITSLKDYLAILGKDDHDEREEALVQLAATYHLQKKPEPLKELYAANKEFMQGRKSEKTFAMFCRPHAEHLQTIDEVYDYINDGEIVKEILTDSRIH